MPERIDERVRKTWDQAQPPMSPDWQERATRSVMAALPQTPGRLLRKGTSMKRRLAYALAFLLVIGLATAGVFSHSRMPDAKSILISVAQAMEEAKTIHVVGQPNGGGEHPWGTLLPMKYERWLSPTASRHDIYSEAGLLVNSTVTDAARGEMRTCSGPDPWFPKGVVTVYPVGKEAAKKILAVERQMFLDGMLRTQMMAGKGTKAVLLREETRKGQRVRVMEVSLGESVGTIEFDVAGDTGYLLGMRQYGPESAGKPLTANMHTVEYNVPIPPETFVVSPAPGAAVLEGRYELREGGNYSLTGPGGFAGPDLFKPSSAWHASSSVGGDTAAAIDGDTKTVWSSGRGQQAGMWFQVAFDEPISVRQVLVLQAGGFGSPSNERPRGGAVGYSCDGQTWQDAYTGQADEKVPLMGYLNGVKRVRAIRITLTAASEQPWSIGELQVYGPQPK